MSKNINNNIYLITSPTNSSSGDGYFDDCPICQAQKLADNKNRNLTESEFKEAALKARKKGAIVGGSLLDDGLN